MPFVSKTGDVVHGKGGMGAFYNNAQFDYGGGPCWLNKAIGDIAVYQHGGGPGETGEGWYLHFYNVHTGEKWRAIQDPASPFYGMGFNFLSADGGVWAAHTVLPGVGLWASTGLHLPYAGLLSVGPEGEIAYAPNYQSGAQSVVQQVDGYIWDLSPSVVYDLQLLEDKGRSGLRDHLSFASKAFQCHRSSPVDAGDHMLFSFRENGGSAITVAFMEWFSIHSIRSLAIL